MAMEVKPYDSADYLDSDEMIAAYLKEELDSNEPRYMAKAISAVVRAKGGFAPLAALTGLSEADLHRAADCENPDLNAIMKVMDALRVRSSSSVAA